MPLTKHRITVSSPPTARLTAVKMTRSSGADELTKAGNVLNADDDGGEDDDENAAKIGDEQERKIPRNQ